MDLLEEAMKHQDAAGTSPAQPHARMATRTWRAMFIVDDVARLERERGEVLRRLASEGFEVHVIGPPCAALDQMGARGWFTCPAPTGDWRNLPALLGAYFIIQGYLIERPPSLVHASGGPVALLGAVAARQVKALATVVTVEDPTMRALPELMGAGAAAELLRKLSASPGAPLSQTISGRLHELLGVTADRIIVPGEEALDWLETHAQVDPARVEVMRGGMGLDTKRFDADADDAPGRDSARARFDLPTSWRQVVGFVGRWDDAHGRRDLTTLIRALDRTHPGVGWLIWTPTPVTSGPLTDHPRVRFIQTPEADLPHVYAALDTLVYPTRVSAHPTRLMEASAMRTATVSYAQAATRAVVSPQQTGLLVPWGDTRALAAALTSLLDAPGTMYDLARNARPYTVQRFARHAAEGHLLRIYDTLITQALAREDATA